MWLVDTNIVSELRKPKPHGAVLAWLGTRPRGTLRIASPTLYELYAGTHRTRKQDVSKAAEIERWIDSLQDTFQIIPYDGAATKLTAELMRSRSSVLLLDAMIAATAKVNGLTVATRNVRDFAPFGIDIVNPFDFGRA